MELEIKIAGKTKKVKLLEKKGDILTVAVDDKIYEVDARHTSTYVWSLLHKNNSYNIEVAPIVQNAKKYYVTLANEMIEAEVIDAQTRYALSRKGSAATDDSNVIMTPMPGKIVKIPVSEGDKVKDGDTVIVVEAMKMQSEYKVHSDKIVKKILVKEGDAIDGNQPLILLEDIK